LAPQGVRLVLDPKITATSGTTERDRSHSPVVTENSIRAENAEVLSIREILVPPR